MKKNLNNFDDLMKNKLDGMDFPFNEANWEKASDMINAARPAKKPFAKILMVSSILITGAFIIGAAYFFSTESNNAEKLAENKRSIQEGQTNLNSSEESDQLTTGSSENKTIAVSKNNSSEKLIPSSDVNSLETNSNLKETNNTSILNSNKKETENASKNDSRPSNKAKYANQKKVSDQTLSSNRSGSGNAVYSNNTNKHNDFTIVGKVENARIKTPTTESTDDVLDSQFLPSISILDMGVNESNEKIAKILEQAEILQPEGSTSSDFARKKDYVKMRHHTLTLEAGAINSFGWKANDVRNGNNISSLIGLNYMYSFNSKSSVLVGVQYNSLANLTESNVSFSVTTYDFGVNNDVTTYKVTGLQYLVAPIKYIHKLDKNNSIGVGLNMTCLLNVKNKIETYKSIESNVQKTETKLDNGYGFDYLNKYNAQIAISYNYKLTKKLGFNAELNQSLSNVFKDYNYFGVANKNSKAAAIKLSLTYTIFNK